jgi:hypothetical protein
MHMPVRCNGKYNMRSHLDELRLGSLFNNCFVRLKFILELDFVSCRMLNTFGHGTLGDSSNNHVMHYDSFLLRLNIMPIIVSCIPIYLGIGFHTMSGHAFFYKTRTHVVLTRIGI